MIDLYESAVQEDGSLGAFFERDDETAYFYLLAMRRAEERIIAALRVTSAEAMPPDLFVSVRWSQGANIVGLFIDGGLTALFDARSDEPQGRLAGADDAHWF
jgi:hypothetical protein